MSMTLEGRAMSIADAASEGRPMSALEAYAFRHIRESVAEEREACAKACESLLERDTKIAKHDDQWNGMAEGWIEGERFCVDAILARSSKPTGGT